MLVLLLIIIPLFFVLLTLMSSEKQAKNISFFGSLVTLAVGIYAFCAFKSDSLCSCFIFHTPWVKALGADFFIRIDGIDIILVLLTALLVPFIIQSAQKRVIQHPKAYFSLILFMQSALFGVFVAKDALLFYVFWELALIPIYLICLVWGGEGRQKITFKFFI